MQNLQELGNFFPGFQSGSLDPTGFCMGVTGTPRQSVGFPGANADPPPEPIETFSCTVIEQLSVSKSQVKIIQRFTNTQDTQKCAEAMCISV